MNLNNNSSSLTHNWNQFHTVLLRLRYRQELDFSNQYLYYINDQQSIRITIPKQNKIDFYITIEIISRVGIDYNTFVTLYREEYQNNQQSAA